MLPSIKYFVSFFFISIFWGTFSYAQKTTRDQLLGLFYKAHTAIKANDSEMAVAAYTEILRLSPGLPDPYLQLGNLYADKVDDVVALKKAYICYSTYLKLDPETLQAASLERKMNELSEKITELQGKVVSALMEDTVESVKDEPDIVTSLPVIAGFKREKES